MGLRDIFRIGEFKQQIQDLTNQLAEQKAHFDEIGFTEYEQVHLGAAKLPIKTKFVKRLNSDQGVA